MSSEKLNLTPTNPPIKIIKKRSEWKTLASFTIAVALTTLVLKGPSTLPALLSSISESRRMDASYSDMLVKGKCPSQIDPINVGADWNPLEDKKYSAKAIDRLSRAVQIPTVSFDDMGPIDKDSRWEGVANFNNFLDDEFPSLVDVLKVERINSYARLYTWTGSSPSLKPIVLMAHMDEVPVPGPTVERWTHDPFAGVVDSDGWLWGRGSADCKNTLMGILGAVEKLVAEGFEPERTIILSFGYDEEIGGARGAGALSATLLERYGKDGIALLVDEGFTGVDDAYGATVASFGVAEKGAVTIKLSVDAAGGHSSVPPIHTSIGILSMILTNLEANPFPAAFSPSSPYLQYLQCAADFGPDMSKDLKSRLKDPKAWPELAEEFGEDRKNRAFLGTTQAVDMISGGIKSNALPEQASAIVNYRIDFLSSVAETIDHITDIITPITNRLNLTFSLDNNPPVSSDAINVVRLDFGGNPGLEPAPITRTEGPAWELMAGTTRHVFDGSVVAPSAMIANTDTARVWNLTRNIYRFVPASLELVKNFHTVDERIHTTAHLTTTRWMYKLIRNTEGWTD
ncbi:hypothetical protein BDY24DRAFT_400131 [Mrakia frigida]|uniref:M20 family metallopeptidase n=1 Tax=Mrakia frigida TaxID=29902 RepID=UPI003FCC263F